MDLTFTRLLRGGFLFLFLFVSMQRLRHLMYINLGFISEPTTTFGAHSHST